MGTAEGLCCSLGCSLDAPDRLLSQLALGHVGMASRLPSFVTHPGSPPFPFGQPPLRLKPFSFTFLKQGVKEWLYGRENGILVDGHAGRVSNSGCCFCAEADAGSRAGGQCRHSTRPVPRCVSENGPAAPCCSACWVEKISSRAWSAC